MSYVQPCSESIVGMQTLSNLTGLKRLNLAHNELACAADKVATSVSHLTNMQTLNLSGNGLSTDTLATCLASMHQLQSLDISWELKTPPPASYGAGLNAVIQRLTGLTRLALRYSGLCAVECVKIAAMLPAMSHLAFLDLRGNCISSAGAGLLLRVLERSEALRGVDMSGNDVDCNEPTIACMMPRFRLSWGRHGDREVL